MLVAPVRRVAAADHCRPVRGIAGFGLSATAASRSAFGARPIKRLVLAIVFAAMLQSGTRAQPDQAVDPTIGLGPPFGLRGRSCKQYDDTGRLYIYSEGLPDISIISWLQRSANGTRPNVPMPEALAQALPLLPGCLPGKHHAASAHG